MPWPISERWQTTLTVPSSPMLMNSDGSFFSPCGMPSPPNFFSPSAKAFGPKARREHECAGAEAEREARGG